MSRDMDVPDFEVLQHRTREMRRENAETKAAAEAQIAKLNELSEKFWELLYEDYGDDVPEDKEFGNADKFSDVATIYRALYGRTGTLEIEGETHFCAPDNKKIGEVDADIKAAIAELEKTVARCTDKFEEDDKRREAAWEQVADLERLRDLFLTHLEEEG